MKIVFAGTQSTGKTTLVNKMQESGLFNDYDFVTSIPRSLGNPFGVDGNDKTQRDIMSTHLSNLQKPNFIADRGILDCFTYTLYQFNNKKIKASTLLNQIDTLNQIVDYDKIFFIRPEFEIVDDGVRSLDKEFQDEVNAIYEQVIQYIGEDKVVILSGDVETRFNQILKSLEIN